jgi:Zn-dependent peptidase ImmA (M78 family)/transcriptional regulator with XRE-family HTH domain
MQIDLFELQRSPVNGRRVRQARELAGLTQSALADALGVDQTMIAHIERGTKQPSAELLDGLSTELHFPPGFFWQQNSPEFPKGSLLFRSKSGIGKRVVSQVHAHAEIWFDVAFALSTNVSLVPVSLPVGADPIDSAREVRQLLKAPNGPLLNLVRNVERLGVLVIPSPEARDCDAFAVWAGPGKQYPVIGMTVGKAPDRTRMSLAHELGHLVLHRHAVGGNQEMEIQAYKFASEFLMPAADITEEMRSERLSLFRLATLKQTWHVSMQALVRRARDLQIISDRQYLYLMKQMSIRGWRTEEPTWSPTETERPRALRKLIEVAFGSPLRTAVVARQFHLGQQFVSSVVESCAEGPSQVSAEKAPRHGSVIHFTKSKRGGKGSKKKDAASEQTTSNHHRDKKKNST